MLKTNNFVKVVCFRVILYIHSHDVFKSYISKLNQLNRRDKISMSTPNIPSLTILFEHFQINQVEQARTGILRHNAQPKHSRFNNSVKQDFLLPASRIGLQSQRYTVRLYMALTLLTYQIKVNMDHNKNLPFQRKQNTHETHLDAVRRLI